MGRRKEFRFAVVAADPTGVAQLQDGLAVAAGKPYLQPLPPPPEIADTVSGCFYPLDNCSGRGVSGLKLDTDGTDWIDGLFLLG